MARLIFDLNAADSPAARRMVEEQVGGYIIEKKLGLGGFGAVYRARRATDQQRIAVKVMLPRATVDQTSVDKFLRESAAPPRSATSAISWNMAMHFSPPNSPCGPRLS